MQLCKLESLKGRCRKKAYEIIGQDRKVSKGLLEDVLIYLRSGGHRVTLIREERAFLEETILYTETSCNKHGTYKRLKFSSWSAYKRQKNKKSKIRIES